MTADLEKLDGFAETRRRKVAIAICEEAGFDPFDMMPNDGPRWRYYLPHAEAALSRSDAARISELEAQVKTMREALAQGTIASVVGGDLVETIELRPAPPPRSDGCDFLIIPLTDETRAARALATGEKP